jgi:molybdopterin synthase catalytic subunit
VSEFSVRIQLDDFDIAVEQRALVAGRTDIGAVAAFTGLCRAEGDTLAALELEHYPGMAEAQITRVMEAARARWPLDGALVIHRFGKVMPGGNIVLVLAASRHRKAAFAAAEFIMDFLKSSAPFWKKEHRADGSSGSWVDAKEADDAALVRWDLPKKSGDL